MATAPVKSPLHNFPLSFLKWGSSSSSSSLNRPSRTKPPITPSAEPTPTASPSDRQWNLRPRRTTPSDLTDFLTTPADPDAAPKSSRLRHHSSPDDDTEKRKLWVALSKDEIEDDFYALTGSKPSRRPRKRPRALQKQVDNLSPGLWLVGVSPEAYRALDAPSKKHK